jgi:hypothetical protein
LKVAIPAPCTDEARASIVRADDDPLGAAAVVVGLGPDGAVDGGDAAVFEPPHAVTPAPRSTRPTMTVTPRPVRTGDDDVVMPGLLLSMVRLPTPNVARV